MSDMYASSSSGFARVPSAFLLMFSLDLGAGWLVKRLSAPAAAIALTLSSKPCKDAMLQAFSLGIRG